MLFPHPARRRKIRMAVIGLGWVGIERHIPNLRRHPDVELVGVMDRKADQAKRVARRFRVAHWAACDDGHAGWIDQVDAVTIATSPDSHYALAKTMLEMGRHVLLEKPMTLRLEDGQRLVDLAQRVNRMLAVVHNFQFARSLVTLHAKLLRGDLGDIRGIAAVQLSNPVRRLPRWYDELPLGLFYDESPHLLYLMRRFAGEEPQFLSAQIVPSTSGKNTPASVTAQFRSDGIPLHLFMNFEAPVSEWHVLVLGSRRLAVADLFRDILVTVRNDRGHRARDVLRTTWGAFSTHARGFVKSGALLMLGRLRYGNDGVIAKFVQAVQDGQPAGGISALDGLRVLQLQHQIIERGAYL